MKGGWRPLEDSLEEAQDDATLVALHDQERAGIDIVSDGEVRRESYFNRFANALDGIDIDDPSEVPSRTGRLTKLPRVVGPIRRIRTVPVRVMAFPDSHTSRTSQIHIPSPSTNPNTPTARPS